MALSCSWPFLRGMLDYGLYMWIMNGITLCLLDNFG